MRVERSIEIYDINTNERVEKVNIDSLSFEKINEIVPANEGDLLLYDCYELNVQQVELFNENLYNAIRLDFDLYYYVLVCLGVYDWDNKKVICWKCQDCIIE
jgi:hypothetical protein